MYEQLADLLVKHVNVSQEDVDSAAYRQEGDGGGYLVDHLVASGKVSWAEVQHVFDKYLMMSQKTISYNEVDTDVVQTFNERLLRSYPVFPLERKGNTVIMGMVDPTDMTVLNRLERETGMNVDGVWCSRQQIVESINHHFVKLASGDDFRLLLNLKWATEEEIDKARESKDQEFIQIGKKGAQLSTKQVIDNILMKALNKSSSDIHLGAEEDMLRVRFRIDGVMQEIFALPMEVQPYIVSRLKVLAKLDMQERRFPQDGSIQVFVEDREVHLRISTIPTVHGESVVLRIHERKKLDLTLSKLGLLEREYGVLQEVIHHPHGFILCTGPTGCGKTTTLYAMLNEINSKERTIITVEDPVEYYFPLMNQVQVNSKIDLNFASCLRSILRQDPDVILIGEVRDLETAEIAVQASLTGHLVFSTLHTFDTVGAVFRMLDIGIPGFLLAESLSVVNASRLVRRICPKCKVKVAPPSDFLDELGGMGIDGLMHIYEGQGCKACEYSGYKGRTGVFEMLEITGNLRSMIREQSSYDELAAAIKKQGMRTLYENAIRKLVKGETALAEVRRSFLKESR